MRIAIATVQVPFVRGGAEAHAEGLKRACIEAGHEADIVTLPFWREPLEDLESLMDSWEHVRPAHFWMAPDRVIALKFPAYLTPFEAKSVWLLHQFREAYDLADTHRSRDDAAFRAVQARVAKADQRVLGPAARAGRLFTNSRNVSRRLLADTGIDAPPLYHPPPGHAEIYVEDYQPVIFAPSRLESLKRQDLLIEAMALTKSATMAVIAGDGTMRETYAKRIEALGIGWKVRLLGAISREEMLAWYANCVGVFFCPRDEDYGYVTLEAMIAAKPVLTCTDSGGPLEFVVDGQTGYVREPNPKMIADAIDHLAAYPGRAREMGEAGLASLRAKDITWAHVIEKLVR